MVGDVLAILSEEGLEKVFVVAHDWGCALASRLADLHADRLLGFAFLAVGYWPTTGSDVFGYWTLFSGEEGYKAMNNNIESAYDVLFPMDPAVWKTHTAPTDALKDFVTKGLRIEGTPAYWTDEASCVKSASGYHRVVTWPGLTLSLLHKG
ncbi:hypothetical protein BDV98DRAFT_600033 [Pterulicium gracile]|uniref:Alpha/Beta hydrolase protein n=1 Tax=Pterulicium gracile TaxID=1884261 RepID=A0A5C3R0F6_9AGAR|nr:hypothetical protein BDV98DRAFT_600033 [Pterula gracilis]